MENETEIKEKNTNSNGSQGNIQIDTREISPQGRYIRLEDKLGAGAYKDVWRAYDTNDGIEVAWNVVKLNRIPPLERKRIKIEVKLLKDIQHKNVIRYYNSWIDREKEQIIFVTEMMSSGSLKHYLRKNTIIRWNAVKKWCKQILTGLEFLHANHIIHRDIKCDNLFINGNTGDLRIGDLGLSTRITEERSALKANNSAEIRQITAVTLTCLGTPEFMAPEMYEEAYDEKVDIYAFGMCVIEMVTGLIPYHLCTSAAQVYRKVINGDPPPELEMVQAMNPRAADFIRLCLNKRLERPSAKELLAMEFLQPNPEDDYKEVRNRHNRLFAEMMMVIDEVDEEDEELDNELQLMMTNTATSAAIPSHPVDKILTASTTVSPSKGVAADAADAVTISESKGVVNNSENNIDQLAPLRTASGGGSNSSAVLRLRKTLVNDATSIEPSVVSVDDATVAGSVLKDHDQGIAEASVGSHSITSIDASHQILIKDIIDHPDKPNTLVIFLQLPITITPSDQKRDHSLLDTLEKESSSIIPSEANHPPPPPNNNSYKLVIEFEYDLIQDTLSEIIEEMLQLEEFHPSSTSLKETAAASAASNQLSSLMKMTEPIISFALHYLSLQKQSTSNSKEGMFLGNSPANYAIQAILSNIDYQSSPSYQLLAQKYLNQILSSSVPENSQSSLNHNHIPSTLSTKQDNFRNDESSNTEVAKKQGETVPQVNEEDPNKIGGIDLALFQDLIHLPEFQEYLRKYRDNYDRTVKDYDLKLSNIQAQKDKTKETFSKDIEQLNARRDDLDRQLDSMQSKYKERMADFSARKNQAVEEHIEKSIQQNNSMNNNSSNGKTGQALTTTGGQVPPAPPLPPSSLPTNDANNNNNPQHSEGTNSESIALDAGSGNTNNNLDLNTSFDSNGVFV